MSPIDIVVVSCMFSELDAARAEARGDAFSAAVPGT